MRFLPVIFAKMFVYKRQSEERNLDIELKGLRVEELSIALLENINIDEKHIIFFNNRLKQRYEGVLLLDEENNLIGYSFWTKKGNLPPTNIPRIPSNAIWVFNSFILEEYRGKGYQKIIIQERDKFIQKKYKDYGIYSDIYESNYASRKSVIKSGFVPNGVYYICIIGMRRNRFLNIRFGWWFKNKKHTEIV